MLFNAIVTIYLLRLLSKTEFALVAVLEILISIFMFTDLGLLAAAIQQAPAYLQTSEGQEKALGLVKCALWYRTLALCLFGCITIIFASQISQLILKTPEYAWAVAILAPGAIGVTWYNTLQGVAQIKNDFYLIARWDFVAGILRQVLSILAYFVFGMPGFLVGMVVSIYIPLIGLGWSLRGFFINRVPMAPFWPTFRYGLPFYIRGFLRFGFLQYDQLVVATLLTPGILAAYSAVRRLTKLIFLFTEAFQAPITMRMTSLRNDLDDIQVAFFSKATRYLIFIAIPLSTLIAAASPWIMQVYGGDKYASEWPMLVILSLAQAAYALYSVYGGAIFARLEPKASLVIDGIVGGVNYLAAPLFVLALGKTGVAWGQLIGFGAGIASAHYLLNRKSKYKFAWESLSLIGVPLILACAVIITGQIFFKQWWSAPIYMIAAGGIFVHLTLKRIDAEDWGQIQTIIPESFSTLAHKIQRMYQRDVIL